MKRLAPVAVVLALATACTTEDTGNLQIFVVPEDSITRGISSGTSPEQIQDGFDVSYGRFLVTIGHFHARRSDDGDTLEDPDTYVLDLVNAPTNGYVIRELAGIAAARWDRFGYELPSATPASRALLPTLPGDADFMARNGYSIYFEGIATGADRAVSFRWGFRVATAFDDCESADGVPGFAVPAGGTVSIKPTIHGDHQFFDNITQGVERTLRLAAWLVTCDRDVNGDLTLDELKACDVVIALPQPPYDLTGVRDEDSDGKLSVYDFVSSELRTLGDFQGDGECPTRRVLP